MPRLKVLHPTTSESQHMLPGKSASMLHQVLQHWVLYFDYPVDLFQGKSCISRWNPRELQLHSLDVAVS